jgi:TPR repeat protein
MMWDHSTANSWDLYGRAMELLEGDGCKRNVPDAAALLRCAVFGDQRDVPPPRKTGVGGGGGALEIGGAPEAQYQLGLCYLHGRGTRADVNIAYALFCAAASGGGGNVGPTGKDVAIDTRALLEYRGHSGAQVALAEMFERGTCVRKDLGVARALLEAAAEGSEGFRPPSAPRETDAAGGSVEAHFLLAKRFDRGHAGFPVDKAKAASHYQAAASEGHARACFDLASLYAKGEGGLPRDLAVAVELCRRAAEIGDADAQHACGVMYRDGFYDTALPLSRRRAGGGGSGRSTPTHHRSPTNAAGSPLQSPVSAVSSSSSSSSLSSSWAGREGNNDKDKDDDDDGEQHRSTASLRSFELASPSGSTPVAPLPGTPMSPSDPLLREERKSGEGEGDEAAKQEEEEEGRGAVLVPRDLNKAVEWWHRAVEQGHGAAQFDLGRAYAYGYGVDRNDERALVLWNLAGFQGGILSHERDEAQRRMRAAVGVYPHSVRVEPYWLFSILDRAPPPSPEQALDASFLDGALRHNTPETLAAGEAMKDRGRFTRTPKKARSKRRPLTLADAERALAFAIAAGDHAAVRKVLDLAIVDDMMAPIPETVRLAVIESGGPEQLLELKRVGSFSRHVNYLGGGKGVDPKLIYDSIDYVGFSSNLEAFSPAYVVTAELIREELGHALARKKHAEIRKAHQEEERLKKEKAGD